MRRSALALVVIAMVGICAAAPVGARTATTATILVEPSTDLVDRQAVGVTGGGFAAGASLAAAECKAGPVSVSDCDNATAMFSPAGADGSYGFDFTVRASLVTANGNVDCTPNPGACVVAVADLSQIVGSAVSAPISFGPPAPPRQGVLNVPAAPVAAYAGTAVTGTDFAPGALIDVALCATAPAGSGNCDGALTIGADSAGAIAYSADAPTTLATLNGDSIDCTVDGSCVYAAWDARDFATLTTAPLRIAPEVAGSITVTPSTALHDLDPVTLTGSGWPGALSLTIAECDGTGVDASCSNPIYPYTDTNGNLSTPYTVRSATFGIPFIDCESHPCWVVAHWYTATSVITASQPISFDTTPTAVTSHYSADERTAVDGAAATLGISAPEEQRAGSWALGWILGITQTGTITPAPDSGPGTITTDWQPSEYHAISSLAAAHGTTLPEFQKTGALLLAYVLAIS